MGLKCPTKVVILVVSEIRVWLIFLAMVIHSTLLKSVCQQTFLEPIKERKKVNKLHFLMAARVCAKKPFMAVIIIAV
jgi:hypothetical protein